MAKIDKELLEIAEQRVRYYNPQGALKSEMIEDCLLGKRNKKPYIPHRIVGTIIDKMVKNGELKIKEKGSDDYDHFNAYYLDTLKHSTEE